MATSTINLSELDDTQGFVIAGVNNGENSGYSVSGAGDVNGDGIDDLIIGAPGGYSDNYGSGGRSYVVFGGSDVGTSGNIEVSELDGSNGFVIIGIDNEDNAGSSVSSAGDINGDGIDDLIIGAPNAGSSSNDSNEGESYVVFGSNSRFDASLKLSELDSDNGFIITGIDNEDKAGSSVSSAGDINGDGIDDLIIGAPGGDNLVGYSRYGDQGESYVVFGSSNLETSGSLELSDLNGSNGFVINGRSVYSDSGSAVSSAGDINGDGIDDLIIGAPNVSYNRISGGFGESYVVFGGSNVGTSGSLELSELNGSNGFAIRGIDERENSGRSVSGAGDINGDGIDDLIIGAPSASNNSTNPYGSFSGEGKSYVVFGSTNNFAANLSVSTLDGTNGFTIQGIDSLDFSGTSVSNAGDINGDGIDDLIIGAPDGYNSEGESYVIFGNSDGFTANLNLANLDESEGFLITGIDVDDRFGSSVSSAGDVNGDGISDIIIGAPFADSNANDNAGESYVIFGVATAPVELIGTGDDDILTGGGGDDFISGNGGDDTLEGLAGDDEILGGRGDDSLIGGEGNDTVKGNAGDDLILGNDGNDNLIGGRGNDTVIGGRGNDSLSGGKGEDLLIGVDSTSSNSNFGIGELDTLTGGSRNDTFALADENRLFYDDGDNSTTGDSDFALITNFDSKRDTIQLHGAAGFYSLEFSTNNVGTIDAQLIFASDDSATGEAIALLENVDPNLSIDASAFTFV